MSLGKSPTQENLFTATRFCDDRLSESSVYRLLYRDGHRLFSDDSFSDLFHSVGRNSVPPRIVATVMVLQRVEGLSDRDAVDRFAFDLRWKYAAGGLDADYPEFVHTVLVGMRSRLRKSERPDRIFEAVLEVAKAAGLVGRKRVLDSTALYDAVATQDTVTLIRSAIRGLLRVVDGELRESLLAQLQRDDDYVAPGKPACDWNDAAAREMLVDELARDGFSALALLDGMELSGDVSDAASLLATVLGQDLETGEDGRFRIARKVAKDRVISTVDPEARHGHKTSSRKFDGYKGHIAIDPDSEIITATAVTAGNVGDAEPALELLKDVLPEDPAADGTADTSSDAPKSCSGPSGPGGVGPFIAPDSDEDPAAAPVAVYGDASYGTAALLEPLEAAGADIFTKTQPPSARNGMYSQDDFGIDTKEMSVTCPAGLVVALRPRKVGSAATFRQHCGDCPLRKACTAAKDGRTIKVHPAHDLLTRTRTHQAQASWLAEYRATRPKVERKFGHLMSRKHGGRCARVRGRVRVAGDFSMLAAATNLKRFAVLGVAWSHQSGSWSTESPK